MTRAMPAARPDRVERGDTFVRALPRGDVAYPAALEDLSDPPDTWYVRGHWPIRGPAVAIVGSRAASAYGLLMARRLASDLAGQGVVVVSGLARGIDAAAHAGACQAGGSTVAVLPGGIDHVAPGAHRALATGILTRGACVSERPGHAPAFRNRFLERNRLIAALSLATVVIEAARRSGALNTAAHARRLGRPILAVPGDVDRETSRGCHALLRQGAFVCEGAGDVLRVLGEAVNAERGPLARLHAALSTMPVRVEKLAQASGMTPREANRLLLRLSWSGLAEQRPGQCWVRGR